MTSRQARSAARPGAAALPLVACLAAALPGACRSPETYTRSADREVADILAEGTERALGGREESVLRPEGTAIPASPVSPVEDGAGEPPVDAAAPAEREAGPGEPGSGGPSAAGEAQGAAPREARVLTLAEALEIAVRTNRGYLSRKEGLYLSALGLSGTRFQFGPRVSATLGYVFADSDSGAESQDASFAASLSHVLPYGGDVTVSGSTALAADGTSGIDDPRLFSTSASVRLVQPLLRGAGHEIAYEALTQAERDLIYSIRDFELFREDFSIDVADRYYSLVQQKQEIENQRRDVASLTFLRRQAEALYGVGRGTDLDVVRARRNELNSQNAFISAEQGYREALDRFRIFLGLPRDDAVDVQPEEPPFVLVDFDVRSAIEAARANRLDYLTEKDRLEDAGRALRIARNGLRPSLDLSAGYSLSGDSDPAFFDQGLGDNSWNVGLNLALPIQQVSERNAWRSAQIAHGQALRSFDQFEDSLEVDVQASFRSLERLRQSLEIQRELIGDEERGLRIAQIRFEAGEISNRDFVEARQSLLAAQNELIREQVNYEIQRLRLLRDLGILFIDENGMFKE